MYNKMFSCALLLVQWEMLNLLSPPPSPNIEVYLRHDFDFFKPFLDSILTTVSLGYLHRYALHVT